jgi:hypothetical protein
MRWRIQPGGDPLLNKKIVTSTSAASSAFDARWADPTITRWSGQALTRSTFRQRHGGDRRRLRLRLGYRNALTGIGATRANGALRRDVRQRAQALQAAATLYWARCGCSNHVHGAGHHGLRPTVMSASFAP